MNESVAGTQSVIVEREFPYPPDKLWRALTQPHLIGEWLMQGDLKPVAGHRFNFRRSPKPGVNIVVDCEVLEIEPNKVLVYSWAAYGLESVVTWTLTSTAVGTRLRMEQAGFRTDQKQAWHGARHGWQQSFANLENVLARTD